MNHNHDCVICMLNNQTIRSKAYFQMASLTLKNSRVRSATSRCESGVRSLPKNQLELLENPETSINFLSPAVASLQSASSQADVLGVVRYELGETQELDTDHLAMPYNNAAIPPPEEITGSASLPCERLHFLYTFSTLICDNEVARVKRILQLDEEISQCSANAAFTITIATVRSQMVIKLQKNF